MRRADVTKWADGWALQTPTKAEKEYAWLSLAGADAPAKRRLGIELAVQAARHASSNDATLVRRLMAGRPSSFAPTAALAHTAAKWREMQVHQLFRLVLEAGLYWLVGELRDGSGPTAHLVDRFMKQCAKRSAGLIKRQRPVGGVRIRLWRRPNF